MDHPGSAADTDCVSAVDEFGHFAFESGYLGTHDEALRFEDFLDGVAGFLFDSTELRLEIQQRYFHDSTNLISFSLMRR